MKIPLALAVIGIVSGYGGTLLMIFGWRENDSIPFSIAVGILIISFFLALFCGWMLAALLVSMP